MTSLDGAVGPVLIADQLGRAVAEAIKLRNPGVLVTDRGAYLRISCSDTCVLSASDVEASTGAPFTLPLDLERVMPSFSGNLSLSSGVATWTRPKARS